MAFYITWMDAVLLALLVVVAAVTGFFVRRLWKWEVAIKEQLEQLRTETKLSDIFSGGGTGENVYSLSNQLFRTLKQQFGLESSSYTQIVKELEHASRIPQELREALIDYFEHMILISYKDHDIPAEERDQLKSKIRLIMKRLET